MPFVYLTTPGTRASLVGERLRVECPDPESGEVLTRDIPLHDVEQVLVAESCSLTVPTMADFARRGIPLILTNRSQRVLALCLPPAPHRVARMAQYRRSLEEPFLLALAVPCVEAKIRNQRYTRRKQLLDRIDLIELHISDTRSDSSSNPLDKDIFWLVAGDRREDGKGMKKRWAILFDYHKHNI